MDLRKVFDDLVRFETDLWNGIDARLRHDGDLPLGSLNVMLVVARTQACRVNDIAAALSITIGGASQAVDRLEKRGLCTRQPNPDDRRSSIVQLTAAGRELTESAGRIFDEELAARLGGPLSASALGHLGTALATLRAATPHSASPGEKP
ncbi:MarR family winged helix-turn-helix transcriptional regulator [Streptantibioticus ferralitis]|uniref:MarR family transcriptional regulator n=1 Tax=Streptantibioticus ferralitis TaxID=236510 RepID=A0ABT5YWM4_9ACTN|nr:MarR family transcriptional regulator [Streptantibioticus ferralitis]MDF2255834.1 MarR family transcriptional regulator [Streptantibioticus ferralitis]